MFPVKHRLNHYRDILAVKRQWERERENEWKRRERGKKKLLTPQTPLHSQWRKKVSESLSLSSLQPPASWRYYRSHLDRCKDPTVVCVCVYVCVRFGKGLLLLLRFPHIVNVLCLILQSNLFFPAQGPRHLWIRENLKRNVSFVINFGKHVHFWVVVVVVVVEVTVCIYLWKSWMLCWEQWTDAGFYVSQKNNLESL